MSDYNTISIESFYPELIEILEVQEAIEEQLGEEVCKRIVKQFKENTPYLEIEGDFENIIQEEDGKWRTPDPNEAKDREALRSKVLLKEFTGYVTAISQPNAKKLKEVRVEALRSGFKNSWEQKDFKTIVTLGGMIPQNILLEDEQLLMYYDIAKDRV